MTDRNQTLSVAESCTGGLITNWLTDIPGSSAFFMNGAITYSNESKINMLNVQPDALGQHGAVSEEVAKQNWRMFVIKRQLYKQRGMQKKQKFKNVEIFEKSLKSPGLLLLVRSTVIKGTEQYCPVKVSK